MMHPIKYRSDCLKMVGCFLDHLNETNFSPKEIVQEETDEMDEMESARAFSRGAQNEWDVRFQFF